MDGAFSGCSSLTTVDVSSATSIGDYAFSNCTSLMTVDLSSAGNIDNRAFLGCTALGSVTLGGTAPMLGVSIFDEISDSQTVTVKIPFGAAASYDSTSYDFTDTSADYWWNGFRGGGWNGSSKDPYGEVNANIRLVFEMY
jgi:hypothetical protein